MYKEENIQWRVGSYALILGNYKVSQRTERSLNMQHYTKIPLGVKSKSRSVCANRIGSPRHIYMEKERGRTVFEETVKWLFNLNI